MKSSVDFDFAAYVLVGPTAVGKSAVAHQIALEDGCAVLSADSMQVYCGMDIGTAKPTVGERAEVDYYGLDLVAPSELFNTGLYLKYARTCSRRDRPMIVAGGTGLYVKALAEGLDVPPPRDDSVREDAARLLETGGLEALQARLRDESVAHYNALSDPANPRRLVRALELAVQGIPVQVRDDSASGPVLAGLRMERGVLRKVIAQRAEKMFTEGLVEELLSLRECYGALSSTAAQAIGYKEAAELVDGRCSLQEAIDRVVVRTSQLAKRQMTWFNGQANVVWVDVVPGMPSAELVGKVRRIWEEHGRLLLNK